MRHLINDNWIFGKFVPGTTIETVYDVLHNGTVSDAVMSPFSFVDIPHDWMIHNTNALYQSSIGCYVRKLNLDITKHNFLYFEGVYMNTTIYLNGQQIFFWPYGYSSFEVDLTKFQKEGENELLVYVDYREPNTRWYSGAGIYRDVWLDIKEDVRLVTDGIYVNSTLCDDGRFKIIIDTEVISSGKSYKTASISHILSDADGNHITMSESTLPLYGEPNVNTQFFYVGNVRVWDIDDPYLYTLTTILRCDDCTYDVLSQNIGFRTIDFDPNKGFFLNGRNVKIHGACMHHDLGSLGAAFNKSALKRQFRELKKMGINSVRTSHNMPSVAFMDLADEMGILIDSEAFDMWENKKTENDYGNFFHDWCEKDVASWVRRDRNRPSVIMWSIGNEIPDTHTEEGHKITIRLRDAVRRNDYRHNAYTTIGSNFVAWEGAQRCSDELELSGYNYLESIYEQHHYEKFPHWCIYGSETASTVQSRGIYHFPKSNRLLTYEDMQCSCLDNCSTNWGAKSVQKVIADDRDAEYCFGQYIWTGWDYIGEPTPYFSKNSFFGHIDTAGFWKDTAYTFKSAWVSYKDDPFVHISPYWDFNPGQLIDINVASNAPKIELYFNDELIGTKELDHKHGMDFVGSWQLPYEKGTIKAVAYDENDNIIAIDSKSSFSNPVKLKLDPETETIKADGEDLMFIAISVLDEAGVEVANARNRVFVTVEGPARLIGLDNGDSTDYDQYKTNSRKLFSGKLMAVVASTTEAGKVKVSVSSEGLADASISFNTVPAIAREGISCSYSVPNEDFFSEVPVRKLTLFCNADRKLNQDNTTALLHAVIDPENATYRDVIWKAVTYDGIEANFVQVKGDGLDAKVTALGDGEFRLLCVANNGKDHTEIMSDLEFSIEGMGSATIDVYNMVHGCQYSKCNVDAILSFRGGVNFTKDYNIITFDNLDFGEYGSDQLAFSIFTFRDSEPVEIWDGEPDNSDLLFKGTYSIPSIYNVYQENIFTLSKRIKGVRSLTFRFHSGFVFGGFYMICKEKAYGKLDVTEYNMITGDSFRIENDGIYAIGNNVDIEFQRMNFTKGISSITITGRSHIPSNPVHVRFHGESGDINQICEFPASEEIQTMTFPIDSVTGQNKVNFIFMPGSNFDFINFQFHESEN
ncbi:MAG: glycoside hydrolase family 2 TIM barrel-domain containing protein [Lachnospiraceae bacterium]